MELIGVHAYTKIKIKIIYKKRLKKKKKKAVKNCRNEHRQLPKKQKTKVKGTESK
jgi:hypothetical protein